MIDRRNDFDVGTTSLFYNGEKPQTLEEAFEISLAAWFIRSERNAILNGDPGDSDVCGLCMLFLYVNDDYDMSCFPNCPIYNETKKMHCKGNVHYISYKREYDDYAAEKEYKHLLKLAREHCPDYEWEDWIGE